MGTERAAPEAVRRAVELAGRGAQIWVATASGAGLPHLTAAGEVALQADGRLRLRYWFCPGTIANLAANPKIGVVVWEPESDTGYQLLGRVERVLDEAFLDGYSKEEESQPVPQVERRLVFSAERVLEFRRAPHNDTEL